VKVRKASPKANKRKKTNIWLREENSDAFFSFNLARRLTYGWGKRP